MRLHGPAERLRSDVSGLAHAGHDSVRFRREVLTRLRKVVPADAFGFCTVDPGTLLLTSAVRVNIPDEVLPRLANNEYGEEDLNKVAELVRRGARVGILSEETSGDLSRSRRYREIYTPLGLGDELRAVCMSGGECWGFISLKRETWRPHFSVEEATLLAGLAGHLGEGLRMSLLIDAARSGPTADLGPGLLELTEEPEVTAMNPSAANWLVELDHERTVSGGSLPDPVYAAVGLRSPELAPPRVRVSTSSGQWLILHASWLSGSSPDRRIAIIMDPASDVQIAPLIAQAYGLSPRERDICTLVLQGLSTGEMAARLFISANTVQDHLKTIFDKVGVRSRRELVGQVFGDPNPPPG